MNQFLINLIILRTNQSIPKDIDSWLLNQAKTLNLDEIVALINQSK